MQVTYRSAVIACSAALTLLLAGQADAGPVRKTEALPVIVDGAQEMIGVGCYWDRGRQYCSRYCYVEVDGRRYCRERARDAHSQAPLVDNVVPAPTMK